MADTAKHLLLVEDEAPLRTAVAEQLADHGYVVEQAATGEEAVARLADFAFDIVLTDLRLPGLDGTGVLAAALERYPDVIGIVITGYGTVKDAVEVIKRGAADFVTKPFQFDELLHVLTSALEQRRLKSENAYLRSQLEARYRFEGIIGRSRVMSDLFQLLETVAATNSTILITGETGTGKELVARAIHHNSPRRLHRFVAINCGALPESLLEAELFGHVRGAFTGAVGSRQGRIEQANRGTLFLDEVGNMSLAVQMRLLRVLQEREFERIGDPTTVKVDVRVIAATNSDLGRMVAEGTFREDLFYRLNVIPVALPPLRDRRDDIPLLARHFLDKYAAELRGAGASGNGSAPAGPQMTIAQEAMRCLMAYAWPGNVRQMENAIERAVALSLGRSQIEAGDLPAEVQQAALPPPVPDVPFPDEGIDFDGYVRAIERELIRRSLEKTRGNKGRAARLLNLKRTTLVEKLKRLERGD
ncbi:MAG: sigma-54-dependent Fis family transcriptional regulator [Acidobacteriota bacterium]|nr:sigma-54-dependent Fis family transcriptional regulator [Acidobacteriota bacterium]